MICHCFKSDTCTAYMTAFIPSLMICQCFKLDTCTAYMTALIPSLNIKRDFSMFKGFAIFHVL